MSADDRELKQQMSAVADKAFVLIYVLAALCILFVLYRIGVALHVSLRLVQVGALLHRTIGTSFSSSLPLLFLISYFQSTFFTFFK